MRPASGRATLPAPLSMPRSFPRNIGAHASGQTSRALRFCCESIHGASLRLTGSRVSTNTLPPLREGTNSKQAGFEEPIVIPSRSFLSQHLASSSLRAQGPGSGRFSRHLLSVSTAGRREPNPITSTQAVSPRIFPVSCRASSNSFSLATQTSVTSSSDSMNLHAPGTPAESHSSIPSADAASAQDEAAASKDLDSQAGAGASAEGSHAQGGGGGVRTTVELSEKEREIFDTLLGTVAMFGLKTQLRVAGGWVRDKLLGRECFDIDIALDDMLGRDFAEKVNKFLESRNETARGVGVIRSNPEQSKHLETATMMVQGQWIDLVNLRAECYAEGSRIPSAIEFGSPKEDALRRDLTINSMFYNITTQEVEDWSGMGMVDLKAGVVRTPLPPMQTFLDDPLRVLRAVRFAARFGFRVDPELMSAGSSAEVRVALGSKVSRERFGKEVEGMLRGRDPALAMQLLHSLGLFSTVFALPSEGVGPGGGGQGAPPPGFEERGVGYLTRAQRLMLLQEELLVGPPSASGEELLVSARLAALLLPLRHCTYVLKKKDVPVSQHIVRESLKLKASIADTVSGLHQHAEAFQLLVPSLASEPAANGAADSGSSAPETSPSKPPLSLSQEPRVQAGKLLKSTKGAWRGALLLCAVLGQREGAAAAGAVPTGGNGAVSMQVEHPEGEEESRENGGEDNVNGEEDLLHKRQRVGGSSKESEEKQSQAELEGGAAEGRLSSWEEKCVAAGKRILDFGLDGVWELKPILNGNEINQLLGLKKGPDTKVWLDRAWEWQLSHPAGSVEACKEWLLSQKR